MSVNVIKNNEKLSDSGLWRFWQITIKMKKANNWKITLTESSLLFGHENDGDTNYTGLQKKNFGLRQEWG